MPTEEVEAVINQIVSCLEVHFRDYGGPGFPKEEFFDLFADAYNAGSVPGNLLKERLFERLIANRIKWLDEFIDSWEDWTLAWDNAYKKKDSFQLRFLRNSDHGA